MLLLWIVLVGILGRRTYLAFKQKKWSEGIIVLAILLTILILSGGWAIFFAFVVGCSMGFELPCYL